MTKKEKQQLAEKYFEQGLTYANKGDYVEAIESYKKVIELKPDYADAYYNLGLTYYNQGDYAEAIVSYKKAIELNPNFVLAYFNLGSAYDDNGDYAKAIASYKKAIELKPDYVKAYNNLGIIYGEQGDYVESIESLKKAIELKPDYAEAYNSLGVSYDYNGDYAEAIASYKKAIEKKPDFAKPYYNLGITYYTNGNNTEAIESYKKAIEKKPDYAEAYNNLGNAYSDNGDYTESIESYKKAIELKPDLTDAYNNLGLFYGKQDDYTEAIESFKKATELQPDFAEAYNNLGVSYDHNGDYFESIESYKKAIELKPDYTNTYKNLIVLCQDSNEYIDEVSIILNKNKKYFQTDIFRMMSLYTNIEDLISKSFDTNIENLIRKLLDIDYDNYFYKILNKYGETDKKNDEYSAYKQIYLSSAKIMRLLHVRNDEETRKGFAHYTRKDTVEKLLIKKKRDAKGEETASRLRLNSILTSNDPTEGEIAFKYLGLENKETDRDYQAFIACFTFDPECLNQFRLYGKEQGKEATGVSLVFDKDFFAEESTGIASSLMASERNKDETKHDEKYALYRCIYIDPETKQIMTLGHKDDYTFFRDKWYEKEKKELSDVEIEEINSQIVTYKEKINETLKAVQQEFEALKELIEEKTIGEESRKNNIQENVICDLLINLRYLVKHIAFKEEQECRVVTVESLTNKKDKKVKLEGDSMFIETEAIDNSINRIYFGPSAIDMELFHEKLVYTGLQKIKCHQCTHPIRIVRDHQQNPVFMQK
jgi:tetratricopeptide (TPR) repeat protein